MFNYILATAKEALVKKRKIIALFLGLIILTIFLLYILIDRQTVLTPVQVVKDIVIPNRIDKELYVDPVSNAVKQIPIWESTRPEDAKNMQKLAALPSAEWIGIEADLQLIEPILVDATQKGTIPVFVVYMIPNRDCSLYSAGGVEDAATYQRIIQSFASIIGTRDAVVILEPDAVAQATETNINCLSEQQTRERFEMLAGAVEAFTANENTFVYVDAGNSSWNLEQTRMVENLKAAGVLKADGFSTNVSNFNTLSDETSYGEQLSQQLDGVHFVIDTSRNGLGPFQNTNRPSHSWCNPPGRGIGHYPTTDTGNVVIDAYLHIKNIGESDGMDPDPLKCFDGPQAGQWNPEYALGLVQRWPAEFQQTE